MELENSVDVVSDDNAGRKKTKMKTISFKEYLQVLFHPNQIFEKTKLLKDEVWQYPMAFLSILLILQYSFLNIFGVTQGGFTNDQYLDIFQHQTAIGNIGGLWIYWVLMMFFLWKTCKLDIRTARNLIGLALVPYMIRNSIQLFITIFSQTGISYPGLSGLYGFRTGVIERLFFELIKHIDIFLLWHIVILVAIILSTKFFSKAGTYLIAVLIIVSVPLVQTMVSIVFQYIS